MQRVEERIRCKKRKEGNLNQRLEVWVVKEGNRAIVKKRKAKLEFD